MDVEIPVPGYNKRDDENKDALMTENNETTSEQQCDSSLTADDLKKMSWQIYPIQLIYYRPKWRLLLLVVCAYLMILIFINSCRTITLHCPACKSQRLFHKNFVEMDFDYAKYNNVSWNRLEPETPLATLFTTWDPAMQKPVVYSNTLRTWSSMRPSLQTVVFTNNSRVMSAARSHGWEDYRITKTSCFGTPVLREMFQEVMKRKRSLFYGFSNADVVFNDGLLKTLQAIRDSSEFSNGPLIVVGKRIDVNISKINEPVLNTTKEVDRVASHGELSWGLAGDYFFTNHLFPWEFVPDVVVGRPLVDNWLIWYARKVGAKVIDASSSVLAVHQLANGVKRIKFLCNKAEIWRKKLLPILPLHQGSIECSKYESRMTMEGNVIIFKKMFEYELCKHEEAIFH